MFNIGPTAGMLQQLLARRGGMPGGGGMAGGGMPPGIMPPMGGGDMMPAPDMGGGMPTIDVGMGANIPGMGGDGIRPGGPRMPPIVDRPMPTFPGGGGSGPIQPPPMQDGPMRKPMMRKPMQGMADKMSTQRPGFWGKYNTIAQGLQGPAMNMLLGNKQQRGY